MRSAADLDRLRYSFRRYDSISLAATALPAKERNRWEQRLVADYTECGCHAGGVALLTMLGILVGVAVAAPGLRTWLGVGVSIAACIAAALAGKLSGVAIARVRLWCHLTRVRELLVAVSAQQPAEKNWFRTANAFSSVTPTSAAPTSRTRS